ncbi:MAG TPA: zf-HC2 domain-containing protein [Vicinamibacterales bacterium]|nr:zf-HC2 domain-containing protein [Vicinamibacterales bacterium]
MTACDWFDSPRVALYFYGELDPAERERMAAHLRECAECRQALEDLRVVREALARQPRVDAPPAGDWSGFMRRLELATSATTASAPVSHRSRPTPVAAWIAIAATLVLAAGGVLFVARARPTPAAPVAARTTVTAPPVSRPSVPAEAAFKTLSEQHLERSKLVVLGLATRDPETTRPADWAYERTLAGSLLTDTRLYRRAAQDRGLTNVARVMGDLEVVLLETSLSDHADRESLERVQRLIRRRDLLVKMRVMGEGSGL